MAAYENFVYRLSNDGKYALRLFVTFSGSNTFFRRAALEKVGLWDPKSLVEDAELSVRFARLTLLLDWRQWSVGKRCLRGWEVCSSSGYGGPGGTCLRGSSTGMRGSRCRLRRRWIWRR